MENSKRVALLEPRIPASDSLGIEKAPTSIQHLAGQLERDGHDVQMFHATVDENIICDIAEFQPDTVGISTMTANFPEGKKVAEAVKRVISGTQIILGGWHASGCVTAHLNGQETETLNELTEDSPFDVVVAGEGELVLSEIIGSLPLQHGAEYELGERTKVIRAHRIKDLDALADPIWTNLPVDSYRDKRSGSLDLSVHARRGCRFACSFCSTASTYGRGTKAVSVERAANYIEFLLERFGPEVITFTDEDFLANLRWVRNLVHEFMSRNITEKYGVSFDTFASIPDLCRIDTNDNYRGLLGEMRDVGFSSFTVGIESMNPEILRRFNKGIMMKDAMARDSYFKRIQTAINTANNSGIFCVGDYMVGNLGETEEQVRAGFTEFMRLRGMPRIYLPVFTPFPGTGLWKEAYESGRLKRTPEGRIDWTVFDASSDALELDYDARALRTELEIKYYTSGAYRADMIERIKSNPSSVSFYRNQFEYLNERFPDNPLVEERLAMLG